MEVGGNCNETGRDAYQFVRSSHGNMEEFKRTCQNLGMIPGVGVIESSRCTN